LTRADFRSSGDQVWKSTRWTSAAGRWNDRFGTVPADNVRVAGGIVTDLKRVWHEQRKLALWTSGRARTKTHEALT